MTRYAMNTLWCAIVCIVLLALLGTVRCQELPDAPQPQTSNELTPQGVSGVTATDEGRVHIRPKSRWRAIEPYTPPTPRSWGETFKSKTFWAVDAVPLVAIAGDEYMTLRGERHGCFEQGNSGPYHVSFGRMASVDIGAWAAVTGVSLLMRKWRVPMAEYAGPLAMAGKHGLGMAHWAQSGCL
jgi:hypothetical protein